MPQLFETDGPRVRRTPVAGSLVVSPYTYARKNAEAESLGRRISAMGDQFADVALKADQIEISRQIIDGKLEYGRFYKDHVAEKQADTNYSGWAKTFEQKHDQWVEQNVGKTTTATARQELENWLENEKNQHSSVLNAEGTRLYAAETRSRIPALVQQYTEDAAGVSPGSEKLIREDLRKSLSHFVGEGVLFSGQVDDALMDFDKGLEPIREAKALVNAQQIVMKIPDRKLAEAQIDALTGVLERADREDLLSQVNRKFDIADLALKEKQGADEKAIAKAILTPTKVEDLAVLRQRIIDTESFDGDMIDKWNGRLDQQIDRLKSGKDNSAPGELGDLLLDLQMDPGTPEQLDRIAKFKGDATTFRMLIGEWEDDASILKRPEPQAWFSKLAGDFGKPDQDRVEYDDNSKVLRRYFIDYWEQNKKLPSSTEVGAFYDKTFVEPGIMKRLTDWIAARIKGLRSPIDRALTADINQRLSDWAAGKDETRGLPATRTAGLPAKAGTGAASTVNPSDRWTLGERFERGGKKYKITGFDPDDGMPLVEEIK